MWASASDNGTWGRRGGWKTEAEGPLSGMLGCYAVCGNVQEVRRQPARVIGEVVGTGVVPVYFGGWSDVDQSGWGRWVYSFGLS